VIYTAIGLVGRYIMPLLSKYCMLAFSSPIEQTIAILYETYQICSTVDVFTIIVITFYSIEKKCRNTYQRIAVGIHSLFVFILLFFG
jgi:hypothetical protein